MLPAQTPAGIWITASPMKNTVARRRRTVARGTVDYRAAASHAEGAKGFGADVS